jgi:hypothetical protein
MINMAGVLRLVTQRRGWGRGGGKFLLLFVVFVFGVVFVVF